MRSPLLKRALDIGIAATVLSATSPVLLVLAIAVKLESPGPALFRQKRVGRHRKPIEVIKLRTMVVDSERLGPAVSSANDPRITKVGAFLRRTKLDELPQLWNVLCGDMSLVGPRPEVPKYVAHYRPEWLALLEVRPGLTDLASITFRDEERMLALARDRERAYTEIVMPEKLRIALSGVAQQSFWSDLAVIARTLERVVLPRARDTDPVLARLESQIDRLNRESESA